MVEARGVLSGGGGLVDSLEEALTELLPRLLLNSGLGIFGEASDGSLG
jgi:hypothetical protein